MNKPSRMAEARSTVPNYKLVPGDIVKVEVFREPDLSQDYTVAQDGTITFPLIGRIPAAGYTPEAIASSVRRGLSHGYLVDPDVRVQITEYRPLYVRGEVNRPGEYPFKPGLTAQQAATLAGGVTRFANESKIYLQRFGTSPDQRYRVTPDTPVYPGDIVTIEERLF